MRTIYKFWAVFINIIISEPVKYYRKRVEIVQKSGDTTKVSKLYDETDQLFTKAKYGVIAQELREIFPDLVYEDNEGNLTVDYLGIIPLLIKVIKIQQKELEAIKTKLDKLAAKMQN